MLRSPKRWSRIVKIAAQHNFSASAPNRIRGPSRVSCSAESGRPLRFSGSLSQRHQTAGSRRIYGRISRKARRPRPTSALRQDYTHSTAAHRRFPDLPYPAHPESSPGRSPRLRPGRTGGTCPHCTEKEDDANKVERLVPNRPRPCCFLPGSETSLTPSVRALADKGTWVRIPIPPIEGRVTLRV